MDLGINPMHLHKKSNDQAVCASGCMNSATHEASNLNLIRLPTSMKHSAERRVKPAEDAFSTQAVGNFTCRVTTSFFSKL